ncbi:MAG: right-handed parallel beta-helix repeat-containing protein [Rhodobacteraceae bacterium]|nr:right-handed parallel beta-helix repeat-containing protein [Paracoccaceae bacterium]
MFVLLAMPGHALPKVDVPKLRADIQNLEAAINDFTAGVLPSYETARQVGLQTFVETGAIFTGRAPGLLGARKGTPLTGQTMDVRLGLVKLAQADGSKGNDAVLRALGGENTRALVLLSGEATLSDIRGLLAINRLQVSPRGPSLTLDVPLIIWTKASVRMAPGETLLLNRASGAFVLNFGNMNIDRATIAVTGEENQFSPRFNPFIATAGAGSIQVDGANISGLGFGHSAKFSGLSVLRHALSPTRYPTHFTNSIFSDVAGISIQGVSDVVVQGNNFRQTRARAVTLARSSYGRVLSNVFSGGMPTNAIRITDGSNNAIVAGNIILRGERAGIVVRNNSKAVIVTNNIVWRRKGGGIQVVKSDCGQVSGNLVFGNSQKGIELRNSRGSLIDKNLIAANHSAGIWVSAQDATEQTFIRTNRIAGNGSGLETATGGVLVLDGNDFSSQFPRLLKGEWVGQTHVIAQNLTGQEQIVFSPNGTVTDSAISANTLENCSGLVKSGLKSQ